MRLKNTIAVAAEKNITLGMIGAGNFAKAVLLPILAKFPDAELHSVHTAGGMSAKSVADRFGFKNCVPSKDDILANESVNTIFIATRHNSHGPLVMEALNARKHVFVEKPLCISIRELKEISELFLAKSGQIEPASIEKGLKTASTNQPVNSLSKLPSLMVGFNRRFSPFSRKVKEILNNAGTPIIANYTINAGFIPKDNWIQDPAEGGGRIIGEICHFIDTLKFLIDSPVRTVQAACVQSNNRSHTNRDSLAVILSYKNGSIGTITYHALGHSGYPKERLELAVNGMITVNNDYCQLDIFGPKNKKIKSKQNKGFDAEIKAFMDSIISGGEPPIPLKDLIETTAVTFAIQRALETGNTVYLDDFLRDNAIVSST
jgi:polar amino acid transport system substrate-binding protein